MKQVQTRNPITFLQQGNNKAFVEMTGKKGHPSKFPLPNSFEDSRPESGHYKKLATINCWSVVLPMVTMPARMMCIP